MLVEDVRDGVLVFEDETKAAKYCDLLQGGGQGCEGVAEVEASSNHGAFFYYKKVRVLWVQWSSRGQPLTFHLSSGHIKLDSKERH
ncbi:hypothetical protein L1987_59939 [Smallanthus sonchifolius]|uniref:Uncharacterized protein n=1 Tax=Smallanthus sonchifolius TaxID=185202 RepID=A0ACB9D6P6_9ASTR|nr:hypothetical protein L1987_59939 [Smallanthus sonchifolius]